MSIGFLHIFLKPVIWVDLIETVNRFRTVRTIGQQLNTKKSTIANLELSPVYGPDHYHDRLISQAQCRT